MTGKTWSQSQEITVQARIHNTKLESLIPSSMSGMRSPTRRRVFSGLFLAFTLGSYTQRRGDWLNSARGSTRNGAVRFSPVVGYKSGTSLFYANFFGSSRHSGQDERNSVNTSILGDPRTTAYLWTTRHSTDEKLNMDIPLYSIWSLSTEARHSEGSKAETRRRTCRAPSRGKTTANDVGYLIYGATTYGLFQDAGLGRPEPRGCNTSHMAVDLTSCLRQTPPDNQANGASSTPEYLGPLDFESVGDTLAKAYGNASSNGSVTRACLVLSGDSGLFSLTQPLNFPRLGLGIRLRIQSLILLRSQLALNSNPKKNEYDALLQASKSSAYSEFIKASNLGKAISTLLPHTCTRTCVGECEAGSGHAWGAN
ncbi:hypothetical protein B0H19DRAFT_1067253 [Mycena capillaripes]|nr:hypothetical protein B0H19DRAFT_1067253 [Mycena capillaripes]